jgi:hypothetical protein
VSMRRGNRSDSPPQAPVAMADRRSLQSLRWQRPELANR